MPCATHSNIRCVSSRLILIWRRKVRGACVASICAELSQLPDVCVLFTTVPPPCSTTSSSGSSVVFPMRTLTKQATEDADQCQLFQTFLCAHRLQNEVQDSQRQSRLFRYQERQRQACSARRSFYHTCQAQKPPVGFGCSCCFFLR